MRLLPVLLAFLALASACEPEGPPPPSHTAERALLALEVPPELRSGEALFNDACAICHGEKALGTTRGPPLVHPYYEPGHHSDAAFRLAIARGVRAHHWGFGDMPPVPSVSAEEAERIIGYLRWLQREAGIY